MKIYFLLLCYSELLVFHSEVRGAGTEFAYHNTGQFQPKSMMETIRKKYPLGKAGFSLSELMIVMAMVAVLAAIATPSILRGLPEKRLRSATRNLYADLQKARLLAVKKNRTVRVRFDQAFYYFDTNDNVSDSDNQWDPGEFGRNLAEYGNGSISYGCNATKTNWNGDAIDESGLPDKQETFFSMRGTSERKSIYLQEQSINHVCYAVTTMDYGTVIIRKFDGTGWDKK